jgi:hypothetical protein
MSSASFTEFLTPKNEMLSYRRLVSNQKMSSDHGGLARTQLFSYP